MTLKEQLHKIADTFPPNSSLEYAIERLIFLNKIEYILNMGKKSKKTHTVDLIKEIIKDYLENIWGDDAHFC